jgi:hypothetical protein
MTDVRPMNFAERLVAGPPVLATVARKAKVGDLVYVDPDGEIFEITHVHPVVAPKIGLGYVPPRGYTALSLHAGVHVELTPREPVVLTKAEAKAARAHYAELEANR